MVLLYRFLCVIHHSWWNTLMVYGLQEYRPIHRFETSAVKAMQPILTSEFSLQLILGFCTLPCHQYWKYNPAIRCSHESHCEASVMESKQTYCEDERFEKMSSPRMSFWNHSPNSVPSRGTFSVHLTLFADVLT